MHAVVPAREVVRIAPQDLARALQLALQAHGASWGVAQQMAAMLVFSQALGQDAVSAVRAQCAAGLDRAGKQGRLARSGPVLGAQGAAALLVAPAALDVACARALEKGDGAVLVVVEDVAYAGMLEHLALRCAERGLRGAVAWRTATGIALAVAGPQESGQWFGMDTLQVSRARARVAELLGDCGADAISALDSRPGRYCIACARASVHEKQHPVASWRLFWTAAQLSQRRGSWVREGLEIDASSLAALERMAAAYYVPVTALQRLRPGEDTDALQVF